MIKFYWTEMLHAVSVIHKAGIIHKVGCRAFTIQVCRNYFTGFEASEFSPGGRQAKAD